MSVSGHADSLDQEDHRRGGSHRRSAGPHSVSTFICVTFSDYQNGSVNEIMYLP